MILNDVQLTGFVLCPIAMVGAIINWTVVYVINKLPSFKHSFGYLSANQAIGDAIHSTTFLFYFCPMVISDSELLKTYSRHCGFLLLLGYELSVHTHFVISFNRFFAAYAPYKYKSFFSDQNTKYIVAFIWVITLSTSITYYEILCNLYYAEETGFFYFTVSPTCNFIGWYLDFIKNLTIIIIIVILDICTVVRVRLVNNRVRSSLDAEATHRFSNREMNFLKQTVIQGCIFTLELFTYFVLPPYLHGKWSIFFSTSFAWVAVHAVDGVVTMTFNPEFRRYIFSCGLVTSRSDTFHTTASHVHASTHSGTK